MDSIERAIETELRESNVRLFGSDDYDTLMEKWSDAARAASAAARRAKSSGGNWRKAARSAFAVASGQAVAKGKGRSGTKHQSIEKWTANRARDKGDNSRYAQKAVFNDRSDAIAGTVASRYKTSSKTGAAPFKRTGQASQYYGSRIKYGRSGKAIRLRNDKKLGLGV